MKKPNKNSTTPCEYCEGAGEIQTGFNMVPCPICYSSGQLPVYLYDLFLREFNKTLKAQKGKK